MKRQRTGLMILDALAGLFLLAALATALVSSASLRQRSAKSFSNQRAALHLAQEALANLQSNGNAMLSDPAAKVSIARSGRRVGTLEWVEVTVVRDGRRASLAGLAPPEGGSP